MGNYRIEQDTLGQVRVPVDARYGAHTQRAIDNFAISGLRLPRRFIQALGLIKGAAAHVNAELGLLKSDLADAIERAAGAVADGRHDQEFPVDVFQTGSGTSTNLNANEVIANLAGRILGRKVHAIDHVNLGQSSNDVFPTAIHVAACLEAREKLSRSVRVEQVNAVKRTVAGPELDGHKPCKAMVPLEKAPRGRMFAM